MDAGDGVGIIPVLIFLLHYGTTEENIGPHGPGSPLFAIGLSLLWGQNGEFCPKTSIFCQQNGISCLPPVGSSLPILDIR